MKLRDKSVLVYNSYFPKRTRSYLLVEIFALAVVYIITARIGQLLAIPPGNVTAVWLPSGIIFVAVLLRGYRIWPGIFLGAFVGNVWSYADLTGFSNILQCLATGMANGIGDVLCAVLGVYLLHKTTGEKDIFLNIKTVTSFILFAAILGPFVSAVLGVTSLCAFGFVPISKYFYTVATWWTGDSVGVLVISPLLLSFFAGSKGIRKSFIGYIIFSVLFVVASLWCLEEITFGLTYHPPIFFMMPFFIFSALLYDRRLTFSLLLLIVGLSVYVAIVGSNSFLERDINLVVIDMQLFFGISSIMILCLDRMTTHQKQTEESLMESEDRYRQVVEGTDDLITRVDSEGKFTFVNHTAREVFGLEPEECIGLSAFDFIHPEDREKTQEAFDGWIRDKASNITFENRQISKTGQVRHFLWSPKIRLDEAGNVAGFDSIARDITERKRIEEDLRKEKDFSETLVQTSPAFFVAISSDGKLKMMNDAMLAALGCSAEEVVGKDYLHNFVPEADRDKLSEVFAHLTQEAISTTNENRVLTKDGRELLVEWHGRPVFDKYGNMDFFIGVGIDITERKRIEEELKLESHMRTVLLDNIPNCFAFILKKGTREIVACNQAAKDAGGSPGKTCYQTCAQRDDPCPFCLAPELWRTNKPKQLEVEYMGRYYEGIWVPLNEELYVHYIFDITERKQAADALRKSEERFKLLYEGSPLGYQSLDADGNLIEANPAWLSLLGYDRDEVIGRSFADFLASGFPELFKERFPCFKAAGEACSVPFVMIRKDGSHVDIEIDGKIGYNPDGSFKQTHCVLHDVTERKRAEEALRSEKDKIQALTDGLGNVGIGVDIVDVNYKILSQNQILMDRFGDLTGKYCYESYMQLAEPCENCPMSKAVASGHIERVELTGADGKDYEILAAPLPNPDGTVDKAIEVVRDITDRKRAEVALKESEERFRSLVDNIPGASYRCLCDEHWTMEFISDEIEELSGYPATDFLQNSVRTYASIIHPEDEKMAGDIALEAIARKEPFTIEYRIATADGGIRWVYEKGQGIFNEQGEIQYLDGVIVDITERKRTEDSLKKERQRFFDLLETLPAFVYLQASDYSIAFANSYYRKHFGDVEGVPCYKSMWGRDEPCEVCPTFKVFDTGKPQMWEWSEAPDGRAYDIYDYPFTDIDGTKLVLEMGIDITERKRTEDALQAKTKEMETLLRVVSHDLRTPLVNIDGFSGELAADCEHLAEMLQHVKADEETKKELETLAGKHIPESLSFIRKGTRKMDDLLKGLSYLAKAGSVKLDIQPLNINDLVGQVVDTMKFSAKEAGAAIELETLPDCLGDEVQINQVFSNLIGNAIKYLDPERAGRIRVWGKVEGDMSQYCVEDNGAGIPDNHKAKVFEIFHRVDPKSSVSGEGLGLTTTKQLVERHKGRIWLESEEGKGSKFFISLPHHCD